MHRVDSGTGLSAGFVAHLGRLRGRRRL